MQKRKLEIVSLILVLLSIAFNSYAVPGQDAESEMIPDVFIPFDTGNAPEYIFVVEKESQLLFVFEFNGIPKKIFQTSCSTGKNIGDKKISGDSKTPEGIYFFTKIHDDAQLAPIYGIRAFPTDYPNLMDLIAGKTGSAIWLHGTNKDLKPRDSNGCVALENSDLEKVSKYITLNRTPIIITHKLGYEPFESKTELKQSLTGLVSGWETALEKGTYHEYLSYYDSEYVPDISWWTEWNKTRNRLGLSKKALAVESKRTAFFKYKDMVVILFDLYIRYGDSLVMTGTKKMFLSDKQDRLKIIGENYQTFPGFNDKIQENPFILASRNLSIPQQVVSEEQTVIVDADIEALIDNWLKAWSSKDINAYGSFYADNFR
ncbi:L,D-transpeptidase family protein, partial [Desulfobacterales bacterium HSG17]|nr:L,D-transpeptidase family protein [Desulfobacterales bacterium HSG17]